MMASNLERIKGVFALEFKTETGMINFLFAIITFLFAAKEWIFPESVYTKFFSLLALILLMIGSLLIVNRENRDVIIDNALGRIGQGDSRKKGKENYSKKLVLVVFIVGLLSGLLLLYLNPKMAETLQSIFVPLETYWVKFFEILSQYVSKEALNNIMASATITGFLAVLMLLVIENKKLCFLMIFILFIIIYFLCKYIGLYTTVFYGSLC
jgi:hypothetical protein